MSDEYEGNKYREMRWEQMRGTPPPKSTDEVWKERHLLQEQYITQLERELNAANQRIKRLEEAGDALKAAGYFGGFNDAVNKWNETKEAKP